MIPAPTIELRPRSTGELLDLTFALYRRHFGTWLGITLVVMGPLMALTIIGNSMSLAQLAAPGGLAAGDEMDSAMSGMLLISLVSLCASGLSYLGGIFAPWMGGALTHNVIERILGRAPGWRDSYRAALPRWGSLWGANAIRQVALALCLIPLAISVYGLLFGAMMGLAAADSPRGSSGAWFGALGLMLACLPVGLIGLVLAGLVAVTWSVSEPAIIGEGAGAIQSLGRSNTLAKGLRWRLFGRLLIFWVMQFFVVTLPVAVLQVVFLGGSALAAESGDLSPLAVIGFAGSAVVGVAANALIVPLQVAYTTLIYLDLRVRREHLDLQLRAARVAASLEPLPDSQAPPAPAGTAPALTLPAPAPPAPEATAPAAPPPPPPAGEPATPNERIAALFTRLGRDGPNADVLNELGMAYHQAGDLNGACDAFTRALELAPGDPDILYNLALAQRDRRNLDAARRLMAEYLRLEPDPQRRQSALDNPALRDLLP